jgi:hypothetical protein
MARTVLALLAAALLPAVAAGQSPAEPVAPPAARDAAGTGPAEAAPSPAGKDATSAPAGAGGKALPRGAVLEDVSGVVRELDRRTHRLEIDTPTGRVAVTLDRNTLVYGPRGLATVLDVQPGSLVRVGRNADFLAYWVAVRATPAPQEPSSTPGQGTGPAGGGPPPSEPNSAPAAPSPPVNVGPGSEAPGGSPGTVGPGGK